MKFKWLSLLFLSFVVVFSACSDDDDHDHEHDNEIKINILEPSANEVFTDASKVHIHIEIEATEENHEIEVKLHPDGNTSELIIDYDAHKHDLKIVFEQDVDLSSYPSGTAFNLEVEACVDHDCEKKEFADVKFSIQ